ncbi:MAG: lytic transglycosylase domain-containing protein [Prevotellaceae bacterium]|jgi:hypothetical protein|nr:lytic transglycosylase domain-containing protein [Prevotellaceae bacterium]
MNKKFILIIFLGIICNSCLAQNADNDSVDNNFAEIKITAPYVPQKVEFAGVEYDLSRNDLRERLDRELVNMQYLHASTILNLKRANRYFPEIEPILKQEKIHSDFKYLALIESNLNPASQSPAGATGLWQFMESSAKEYGLTVNANIDERLNIEKSTIAACRFIKDLYASFGNWTSVAAAYNAGKNRISKELEKQGEKSALDLWLNTETSRYFFRILAAKIIFSDPQKYGFYLTPEQLYPPVKYKKIEVDYEILDLAEFAKQHKINYLQLKSANLWLRDRFLENKKSVKFTILIPKEESLNYNPEKTKDHNEICK